MPGQEPDPRAVRPRVADLRPAGRAQARVPVRLRSCPGGRDLRRARAASGFGGLCPLLGPGPRVPDDLGGGAGMRRWGGAMAATTCFAFAMIRALESGAAWQRYLWAAAAPL